MPGGSGSSLGLVLTKRVQFESTYFVQYIEQLVSPARNRFSILILWTTLISCATCRESVGGAPSGPQDWLQLSTQNVLPGGQQLLVWRELSLLRLS